MKKMRFEKLIVKKLSRLERDIEDIKEHMIDVDTILTEEEKRMLDESIKNQKKGKLVSLEDVEKRLRL